MIHHLLMVLKRYPWIKKQILKAKISFDFPIYLHIEPASLCNLKCSFCPYKDNPNNLERGLMKFDLYKKIIDEVAEYKKTILLLLHKDGESLLHPDLVKMINYAKEKKAAKIIHFATNGILLNEKKSINIINSGLDDILISIDAARKDTYLKLKGVDKLGLVENNVINFMKLRKKLKSRKPFVRAKMIDVRENHAEIDLFRRKWQKIVDRVEITKFFEWPQFKKDSSKNRSVNRYACTALWYSPAINWDGRVSICCFDADKKRIIGDVNKESIYDIWCGEKLRAIREAHLNSNYKACSNCTGWSGEPNLNFWLRKKHR